jgi:hypothetical protein
MAHPRQAHYDHVVSLLQPLSAVFGTDLAGVNLKKSFDEFLAQNELEIALHVACDFLLHAQTRPVENAILARIEAAHEAMVLKDDCISRLRSSASE